MDIAIIFVFALLFIVSIYYLFRQKKPLIEVSEVSNEWRKILQKEVAFYRDLDLGEKVRFENSVLEFLKDVKVTGVETQISDTDKLLVASSAVIPLFGYPGWRYRNLDEVLLYKTTFNEEYDTVGTQRNVLGMVGEGEMNRMMILSRPALYRGFKNKDSRSNVGIHEFVHLLDKADGTVDGIPEILMKKEHLKPWAQLMHREISAIQSQQSDIDPYALTNEGEFLSVISEYFFEQPELFKRNHKDLYELLEKIYHQDLA